MKVKIEGIVIDLNDIENISADSEFNNHRILIEKNESYLEFEYYDEKKRDLIYKKLVWLTKANILMNKKGIE